MVMNIVAILIVLVVGYTWVTRGFFSALLHMLCVIVAGAVAFGLWEQAAYFMLGKVDSPAIAGVTWGLCLTGIFAITIAVMRPIVDKLIGANLTVPDTANYIGGGVCGLVSGVITSGIVVISLGMLRFPSTFWFQPVEYQSNGSITRAGGLWVPVDKLTASLYKHLSTASFGSSSPLAVLYPDLADMPFVNRVTFQGRSRNWSYPGEFQVTSRFTVGGPGTRLDELLSDAWNTNKQGVMDLGAQPYPADSHIEGFVIKFNAKAREKGGDSQVVIGNGQIRLVATRKNSDDDPITVHPIAVTTQAAVTRSRNDPGDNAPRYGRFRYDAKEVFICSVGGTAEPEMAFEFVVPNSHEPRAIYVRNIREDISAGNVTSFANAAARDAAISGGTIVSGQIFRGSATDGTEVVPTGGRTGGFGQVDTIAVTSQFGFALQKGAERGLSINEKKRIYDGDETYTEKETSRRPPAELRITEFETTDDTALIQVNVSPDSRTSLLGRVMSSAEDLLPPLLVDTTGTQYQAIGFIYKDDLQKTTRIRFTPGQPIRSKKELPALSRSKPDDQLILIFRVTADVQIDRFAIGEKIVATYQPAVRAVRPR